MALIILLLSLTPFVTPMPPDRHGELLPETKYFPLTRIELCLVKSKPPIPGMSCPSPVCTTETTLVLHDEVWRDGLFERYPGSYLGACDRE